MCAATVQQSKPYVGYGLSALLGALGLGGITFATVLVASKIFGKTSWRSTKTVIPSSAMGGSIGTSLFALFRLTSNPRQGPSHHIQPRRDAMAPTVGHDEPLWLGHAGQFSLVVGEHSPLSSSTSESSSSEAPGSDAPVSLPPHEPPGGGAPTLLLEPGVARSERSLLQAAAPRLPSGHDLALSMAMAIQNPEAVQRALENGADPLVFDDRGWTPLHWAAFAGNEEVLRKIVETVPPGQIDILAQNGHTALRIACSFPKEAIVELLIQSGANPTAQYMSDNSPLHWVARHGTLSILEKLLSSPHLEVDARDSQGRTALYLSVAWGGSSSKEKAEILLQRGADPRLIPDAIKQGANPEIQGLLVEAEGS